MANINRIIPSSKTVNFCNHKPSSNAISTDNIHYYCITLKDNIPLVYIDEKGIHKRLTYPKNTIKTLDSKKYSSVISIAKMPECTDENFYLSVDNSKSNSKDVYIRTNMRTTINGISHGLFVLCKTINVGNKVIPETYHIAIVGSCYNQPPTTNDKCWNSKVTTSSSNSSSTGSSSGSSSGGTSYGTGSSDLIGDFTSYPAINASDGYVVPLEHLGSDKNWLNELQTNASFFNMRSVLGVFGLPYQFLPTADPRLTPSNSNNTDTMTSLENSYLSSLSKDYGDTLGIGEEYAEHIVANLPILFMSPGMPNFMGSYSEEDKKDVLHKISTLIGITDEDYMTNLSDRKNSKYYTFQYKVPDYYRYVNPMCRLASQYLGIGETILDGVPLHSVNWMDYTSKKIKALFESDGPVEYLSIPFYIESENQISENMSNDTQEPMLAGIVNPVGDTAREMQFILGYANGNDLFNAIKANPDITSNADNINNTINNALNGGKNNFLSKLTSHIGMLMGGAKLLFPKVWSGSAFSRSYDITIKLRSPDMDNLSLYFNIIVPTFHLIGFVAPHSMETNPNGYGNPFIVRAIYKGFFNVDMGIITSMGITKGDQAQWNANGIPSSVDINFTISDLYECMGITPTGTSLFDNKLFKNHIYETMDNTAQMDYIANFCGINIYKPEIGRLVSMWAINNIKNKATDMITINMWGNIRNSVASRIMGIFRAG